VVVGGFLVEILEGGQRLGAGLDFVQDKEVGAGLDRASGIGREVCQNAAGVEVSLENRGQPRVALEVEIMAGFVILGTELAQEVGFPGLSRPAQDEGFAMGRGLPSSQVFPEIAFHGI
jgi:hypothetical protein